MFKNFLIKKMLKAQGVPDDQLDMIIAMMEKNPDLFKTIAAEVQAKIKQGKDQMAATMEVLEAHKAELEALKK